MRFAGDDQSGWNYLPCALPIEQSNRAGIVSRKKAHVDTIRFRYPVCASHVGSDRSDHDRYELAGMWARLGERMRELEQRVESLDSGL